MSIFKKHVNKDGNLIAKTTREKGLFGDDYEKTVDRDGNLISKTTREKGLFGDDYKKTVDKDGNLISKTTREKGLFGEVYEKTVDKDGNVISKSTEEKSGCFITEACMNARDLPDDCYELTVLREFRDRYVLSLSKGEQIVRDYYEVAPRIVSCIEKQDNVSEIYTYIYEIIMKVLKQIEIKDFNEAINLYINLINELKDLYIDDNS